MADAQNEKESGTADATAAVNAAGQDAQATDEADKAADQTGIEAGADSSEKTDASAEDSGSKRSDEQSKESDQSGSSEDSGKESESDAKDPSSDDEADDDGKAGAKSKNAKDNKNAEDTKDDEDDDLSEDVKSTVNALLDSKALESKDAPNNVKRLANREKDNNRRVQDTIKNAKTNPKWFVPLFVSLLIIGLAWVIIFYATSQSGPGYPIPAIGNWNLLIGFLIMLAGFIMTMWWN